MICKNQIYFYKVKNLRFVKKNQIYFEKLKNEIWSVKIRSVFKSKKKKKRLLKEESHSWNKLTMHASHIKKKDFNLTLNSFFENLKICNFIIIKIKKKTFFKKIFKPVFDEKTNQFYDQKKYISVFNENTD